MYDLFQLNLPPRKKQQSWRILTGKKARKNVKKKEAHYA
jgi:hypothetical protein